MRVLCLSAPLPGHVDWGGYLPTAVELQRRGHEVLWVSGQPIAALIAQSGLPFAAIETTGWRWPPPAPLAPGSTSDSDYQRLRAERALDQWLDPALVTRAVEQVTDIAERFRPQLIVSEMFVAAAGVVAEQRGFPLVVAGWPAHAVSAGAVQSELMASARRRLQQILERSHADGINFTTAGPPGLLSPHLHISYWSPSWFAGAALLPQTLHVGGSAPPPEPADPTLPSPDDRPWVLITLGTTFGNDLDFFVMATHAVAQLGATPIVALGGQLPDAQRTELLTRLPATAVLRERVRFASVLPYTAGAIHHGGAGVTHALAVHAIPQIVVPHAADQHRQALGVERSGAGLSMPPRTVTVNALVDALAQCLPDLSPLRARALALKAELATLGGAQAAAQMMESVVKLA